jgi:hypothetical protein
MTEIKDFEAERIAAAADRAVTFTVAGHKFHVRPFVPPEMLLHFDSWTAADTKTTIEGFDNFIIGMIEPSEEKTWRKVRKDAKPPLNLDDVENIAFWLLGEAAGRPTKPPSPSQPGNGDRAAATSAGS